MQEEIQSGVLVFEQHRVDEADKNVSVKQSLKRQGTRWLTDTTVPADGLALSGIATW